MAKIYSLSFIEDLHKRRKAQRGVKYYTKDRVFIGDENGYMLDITAIQHETTVNNQFITVEADLTALEERVSSLETSKADKCYSLAMSIIL